LLKRPFDSRQYESLLSIIRSNVSLSSLYGSARNTHLQKVESIKNKCLRLIIGTVQSTPYRLFVLKLASPLHFRRIYLTDRFLTKSMSYSPTPLIQTIIAVASHWRFTPAKLPLLCQKAKIILKLQKNTPFNCSNIASQLFPTHPCIKNFTFTNYRKLTNSLRNIILITSSNTTFLKQHSFSLTVLEASSILELQSGSPPHPPHFLSLFPHSHLSFTPNNELLFSLPSIT